MEINKKTALITGGAHRVGRAITLGLAERGANVVINYNSSAGAAEETVRAAEALGVGALAVQADVSDHAQVARMVAAAQERFGGVEILVNAASRFEITPFPLDDLEAWHRVTGILINGSFYCANEVAPLMLQAGGGAIINIIDLAVWESWPNFTAHVVGKAALMALTRQLALELAPSVRVNAVAPGNVLPPPGRSPERVEELAQRSLQHRWGAPQDVVQAINYLLDADFVTGHALVVDGGELLARNQLPPTE